MPETDLVALEPVEMEDLAAQVVLAATLKVASALELVLVVLLELESA